jgi:hypothetical protein
MPMVVIRRPADCIVDIDFAIPGFSKSCIFRMTSSVPTFTGN